MERPVCQIAGCNEPAGLNPADVLLVPRTVSVDPGATRHLVPLCDQHRAEYDAGTLDLPTRLGPPAQRWTRRCKNCGWVDPDAAAFTSKESAERTVHSGYGEEYTSQTPHCPECGAHDFDGILVDDPPQA